MKKTRLYLVLIAILLIQLPLMAAIPNGISYQAVVRNGSGVLVTNQPVGLRISILQGSEDGTKIYSEQHAVNSNVNGLVSLQIGEGDVITGAFASINWSNAPYYVLVEVDPEGGTSYSLSSITQLLAVPYAFHSKSADELKGKVDYNNLLNLPVLKDTVEYYGFSGNWDDIEGKPNFESYMFSGDYNDLSNLPAFKDSISMYGFSGNYNDLSALPVFKDSVEHYGFSGSWNDLADKPNLEDGVFSGDYNDLANRPVFKDSISIYGFSGRYSDLSDLPVFKDSIALYGFNKNYNELNNLPSFSDSISKYGFSGDYYDLNQRPTGKTLGDILYWDGSNDWSVLPIGSNGQILSIKNGIPTWIDNAEASLYSVGELFLDSNNNPLGIVVEISSSGDEGKIISLVQFDAAWDPLATKAAQATGYTGTLPSLIGANSDSDGEFNSNKIKKILNYESKYPAVYSASSLGEGWYLPSAEELKNLVYRKKETINQTLDNLGKNKLQDANYWSSTEKDKFYAKQVAFKGYATGTENILAGEIIDTLKATSGKVVAMRRLTAEEINSKPDNYKLYNIGDIYYENDEPVGIVYEIKNGGFNGKVISIEEDNSFWSYRSDFVGATNTTNGQANFDTIIKYYKDDESISIHKEYGIFWTENNWYVPAQDELLAIYNKIDVINAAMRTLASETNAIELKNGSDIIYWSSTEVDAETATAINFNTGNITNMDKYNSGYLRGIKEF